MSLENFQAPEIAVILHLVEAAIQDEPQLATDLQTLLSQAEGDWDALRAKYLAADQSSESNTAAAAPAAPQGAAGSPQDNSTAVVTTPGVNQNAATAQPGASISAYLPDGTPNPAFVHKQ